MLKKTREAQIWNCCTGNPVLRIIPDSNKKERGRLNAGKLKLPIHSSSEQFRRLHMHEDLASYFLPEGVLEYFEATDFATQQTLDRMRTIFLLMI